MVCVHVTSSAKGRGMQSLLEKPTSIRSACISLTHTHAHSSMYYIHVAACLQLCLPPPASPPLAHSNRTPQRMYASVHRCMPIARLGLIHNNMPSHIRSPFSNSGEVACLSLGGGKYTYCPPHPHPPPPTYTHAAFL